MSLIRIGLWITFLLLAGQKWNHWQQSPALPDAEERFQSELVTITKQELHREQGELSEAQRDSPLNLEKRDKRMLTRAKGTHESWPRAQDLSLASLPRITVEERNSDERRWLYRSPNFDFTANAPLKPHVIREFASLFELTHLYCRQLPLGLERLHGIQPGGLQVNLIENTAHYVARGGIPGSMGVYRSDVDVILVPFAGIGLKAYGGSYSLDHERSNQTLIHEATHMLMRGPLLQDGWFVEGAAEYVATIPMHKSTLLVPRHRDAIKSYLTSYGYGNRGGHNLGDDIRLTSLEDFMEADYTTFQNIPHAYPYALILFHYFAHSDGAGDAERLRAYAHALHQGASTSSAREHLLAGRSYQALEELLARSWQRDGISLTFDH
jgi:hypothetical protein